MLSNCWCGTFKKRASKAHRTQSTNHFETRPCKYDADFDANQARGQPFQNVVFATRAVSDFVRPRFRRMELTVGAPDR
ncbi:MAG: hypothetical protein CMJ81_21495 [Planctomycetaceae bacterium]|nr:hypothetical protein [Planctomycetaceae bacterium]